MKEAAGEANLTVVTIILIAAVVAIATPIITTVIKSSGKKTCCTSYGAYWKDNKCVDTNGTEVASDQYWNADKKECKEY